MKYSLRQIVYGIILLVCFYSCGLIHKPRTGPHAIIVLAMDTTGFYKQNNNGAVMNLQLRGKKDSAAVMNRLTKIGIDESQADVSVKDNRITVKLWGIIEPGFDMVNIRNLLQSEGNLSFWETFNASEMADRLVLANKTIAGLMPKDSGNGNSIHNTLVNADPLFKVLRVRINDETGHIITYGKGAELGDALAEDTAKVDEYLRMPEVRVIFPQDSKFLWERPRDKNEPLYQLVAVRLPLSTRQAPLSGDIITDARLEYYDGGGSHPQISLTMNPVAAHVWANLTSNNVGRCIAIEFNGIIYSAPIVESQISGGRSSITGNFDPIEARQLVAILSAGYMPVPLKIVEEKREE